MTTPNYLIDALVARATIALKVHQEEVAPGIIDYERFQEDMYAVLQDVEQLQEENEQLIANLRKEVAEKDDAIEQRNAIRDLYNKYTKTEYNFTTWSMS